MVDINENFSKYDVHKLLGMSNIATGLEEEQLDKIGRDVVDEYIKDEQSRVQWIKHNDEWMKLALQITEVKNYPWQNSANVKYPLITTAALQFAARAYPALIKNPSMVRAKVTGYDPDGSKADSAERISKHMSFQILEQMDNWEEDMDKLTMIVPITGCVFKKTYFSPTEEKNCSELVHAKDLCINYYAKSLKKALRVTHILELDDNDIYERIARELYLPVELNYNKNAEHIVERRKIIDKVNGQQQPNDTPENTPRVILEQHRFLDLDDDGYKEPYIVTVDFCTKKVLRIVARFDADGIKTNENNDLLCIKPLEYFTQYDFIPNPEGGIYGIGFGVLLGSLNETINTLINLLLDAGRLSNMQSGFIARGLRLKNGKKRIGPGEWISVNSTGNDLRNGIFPLPVREPSATLFSLLGTILESGQRLSSIVDILTGENPGQNQKATTTLAVIEQGLKVFTAIHKRLYRSLTQEFNKIFYLNSVYLEPEEYYEVLDDPKAPAETIYLQDYQSGNINVRPSADPNIATEIQKITKAQAALELAQTGQINVKVAVQRLLEAMDQPNIDELMAVEQRGPSLDELELQLKKKELTLKEEELEMIDVERGSKSIANLAKAEKDSITSTLDQLTNRLEQLDKITDIITKLQPSEQPTEQG